jgi:hypothetical protein
VEFGNTTASINFILTFDEVLQHTMGMKKAQNMSNQEKNSIENFASQQKC